MSEYCDLCKVSHFDNSPLWFEHYEQAKKELGAAREAIKQLHAEIDTRVDDLLTLQREHEKILDTIQGLQIRLTEAHCKRQAIDELDAVALIIGVPGDGTASYEDIQKIATELKARSAILEGIPDDYLPALRPMLEAWKRGTLTAYEDKPLVPWNPTKDVLGGGGGL